MSQAMVLRVDNPSVSVTEQTVVNVIEESAVGWAWQGEDWSASDRVTWLEPVDGVRLFAVEVEGLPDYVCDDLLGDDRWTTN